MRYRENVIISFLLITNILTAPSFNLVHLERVIVLDGRKKSATFTENNTSYTTMRKIFLCQSNASTRYHCRLYLLTMLFFSTPMSIQKPFLHRYVSYYIHIERFTSVRSQYNSLNNSRFKSVLAYIIFQPKIPLPLPREVPRFVNQSNANTFVSRMTYESLRFCKFT